MLERGKNIKGKRDDAYRRGLPMVESHDPEALKNEVKLLEEINSRPHFWQRWRGYFRLSGP